MSDLPAFVIVVSPLFKTESKGHSREATQRERRRESTDRDGDLNEKALFMREVEVRKKMVVILVVVGM